MAISKEQQRELKNLARAANRRLERATREQRNELNYYLRKYTTITGSRGIVFSQAKAKTEREYKKRMKELSAFMSAPTSTRTGYEELKKSNLESAVDSLKKMNIRITTNELKAILEEEKAGHSQAFYSLLENVSAKKRKWHKKELTKKHIEKIVKNRESDYKTTLELIKSEA